jgi:hypothetical protein
MSREREKSVNSAHCSTGALEGGTAVKGGTEPREHMGPWQGADG